MGEKLDYSSETLLNTKLPVTEKGSYDAFAVDSFLDKIILDYKKVENNKLLSKEEYEALVDEIKKLKDKCSALEIENASYKNRFNNINDNDNVSKDNIRLVQRINILEKFLWQNGYNPNTIK